MGERRRRTFKWTSLAITLLLGVDVAISWVGVAWSSEMPRGPVRTPTGFSSRPAYWIFTLRSGGVGGGSISATSQIADIDTARGWSIFMPSAERKWGIETLGGASGNRVYVPLWMFTAASLLPAALLWWQDHRTQPGHCRRCGYDLSAVVGEVCPECGTGRRSDSSSSSGAGP
ncbi:MAG: hypothetical protein IT435_11635 [Phycisphaerales bacterium]|nr:hypothetical protein [Phycisphaerales bacterium]